MPKLWQAICRWLRWRKLSSAEETSIGKVLITALKEGKHRTVKGVFK